MSWQLGSLLLVVAALAAGLWWYERSRPPAKLIAMVATLAALAALGRDAFAAVPDVKPITAIVLVGGLAFGARPGFAIGATAALASNVLLGEGPWTPWQMLGWGLVGLLGAGLGRASGRSPAAAARCWRSRARSARSCSTSSSTSTRGRGRGRTASPAFGVVLGSAIVFDLTHVVASFVFGYAFGPALLRMLMRVRGRLEVRWQPAVPRRVGALAGPPSGTLLALALCVPVLVLGLTACAGAAQPAADPAHAAGQAIGRELAYLRRAQNADGGFGAAPGEASTELYSAWAAIGIAATGRDPLTFARGGHTVLDAIRGEASTLEGAGDLERTILALRACGAPVRELPGGDPVARLLAMRAADGSFGHLSNLTAFGVLALRAAGYGPASAPVLAAASWLARQQDADGGFNFATAGGASDLDDTGAVLQALAAARPRRPVTIARAVAYIRGAQNLDGGFPQSRGGSSNAQSTAWAVQGLIAASRNPSSFHRGGSTSPLGFLESLVASNGSVRYSRTGAQTPVWVTAQALTALAGRAFPIAPG